MRCRLTLTPCDACSACQSFSVCAVEFSCGDGKRRVNTPRLARCQIKPVRWPSLLPELGVHLWSLQLGETRVGLLALFGADIPLRRLAFRYAGSVEGSPTYRCGRRPTSHRALGDGGAVNNLRVATTLSTWDQVLCAMAAQRAPTHETVQARVAAVQAGDSSQLEPLLLEILPRVRNLVRYLCRGDSEVDDIAQEALIAIVRGIDTYRADGAFSAWVNRVVARTTLSELKRRRRLRRRLCVSDKVNRDLALAHLWFQLKPVEQYVLRREAAKRLDQLSPPQRQALVLHLAAGFRVDEVAQLEGVSVETIRSRIRLGKQRLRRMEDRQSARANARATQPMSHTSKPIAPGTPATAERS